jgi:hypothetical protein
MYQGGDTLPDIKPQPGPQTRFLATKADVAIYGGAAGGGKSWALLMEALRHTYNKDFGAVIFRRTYVQIKNEGGLWDESIKIYPLTGAKPRENDLYWRFPSGAAVSFSHVENDKTVLDYQGAQIAMIGFDELTHFTDYQFWYLFGRNRSVCGVKPYIRATCNPDADSWVAKLIEWWINQDTGYPIPERSGVIRWFVRLGANIVWADSPSELAGYVDVNNVPIPPKSFTFIPSKLTDNKILMRLDPGYIANLMALPFVERERLLSGNWKIRHGRNSFFDISLLMLEAKPVAYPTHCDSVYAIMDTASKTGTANDGTAVIWSARSKYGIPITILDWDITQIEGGSLIFWLPSIFARGEELARLCGAREGFLGVWIEDKNSGTILLQQAIRSNLAAYPIESALTALGKDERALSVSGYVQNGDIKISEFAYNKVVIYKDISQNHLISQIRGFSIGDKEEAKRADDLLDCFTYTVALGVGDREGF